MGVYFFIILFCVTFFLALPLRWGISYVSKQDILTLEVGILKVKYKKKVIGLRKMFLTHLSNIQPSSTSKDSESTDFASVSQEIPSDEIQQSSRYKLLDTIKSRIKNRLEISKKHLLSNSLWLGKKILVPLEIEHGHAYLEFGLNDAKNTALIMGGFYTLFGLFQLPNRDNVTIEIYPHFEHYAFQINLECIIRFPVGHIISIFFYSIIFIIKSVKRKQAPYPVESIEI